MSWIGVLDKESTRQAGGATVELSAGWGLAGEARGGGCGVHVQLQRVWPARHWPGVTRGVITSVITARTATPTARRLRALRALVATARRCPLLSRTSDALAIHQCCHAVPSAAVSRTAIAPPRSACGVVACCGTCVAAFATYPHGTLFGNATGPLLRRLPTQPPPCASATLANGERVAESPAGGGRPPSAGDESLVTPPAVGRWRALRSLTRPASLSALERNVRVAYCATFLSRSPVVSRVPFRTLSCDQCW
ncbi:unnamed protein product, partial [Iphiclides podalirius]